MKMMKNLLGVILFMAASMLMISCENQMGTTSKDVTLNNELDSVSYAIGIDIASNIKKSGFEEINPDAIAKGFADVYADSELLMDAQAANTYVMAYFNKARERKSAKNLEDAEAFLAENKEKEGVITTESGLQYKVITEGTGPIPVETDKVSVNYKGTLTDGREFDASQEGNPAQFRVNGVIKGWIEALQLMPVGSKWELYIHPDLAYGANPRQGGIIEPNHMLIFEIELLEIIEPQK
jgi:FKBP-type peptidyl-prolyl cis-trans isomerase FklB